MKKNFPPLLFLLICLFAAAGSSAQVPAADTTAKKKPKKPDYSHLLSFPEFHTNIFGTVVAPGNPGKTQMFPKGGLFGDSSHYISHGAKFEMLNDGLTPSRSQERMLIKVLSNPPLNEFVGDTGWIFIQHTTLYKYYDRDKNRVDTNFLYTKYVSAATHAREDAIKTKCPANKKCYFSWADYYDCMANGSRFGHEPNCALVSCALEDCPADNK